MSVIALGSYLVSSAFELSEKALYKLFIVIIIINNNNNIRENI